MQFLVIGMDGTDAGAPARRQKVRADHLALGDELVASGEMWYGAAIRDDEDNMIGSMLVMDFESEEALQKWLDREPYVTGDVWKSVTVQKCSTRNPWQFNRSQEWFERRVSE